MNKGISQSYQWESRLDLTKTSVMTATATETVKDQELTSFGLIESASVNSFADFTPSKLNQKVVVAEKKKNDFINIFICHLIFYAVFCISLALHILIDLGLGSYVKNKFLQLIENPKNNVVEKNPAFAWFNKIYKLTMLCS